MIGKMDTSTKLKQKLSPVGMMICLWIVTNILLLACTAFQLPINDGFATLPANPYPNIPPHVPQEILDLYRHLQTLPRIAPARRGAIMDKIKSTHREPVDDYRRWPPLQNYERFKADEDGNMLELD